MGLVGRVGRGFGGEGFFFRGGWIAYYSRFVVGVEGSGFGSFGEETSFLSVGMVEVGVYF